MKKKMNAIEWVKEIEEYAEKTDCYELIIPEDDITELIKKIKEETQSSSSPSSYYMPFELVEELMDNINIWHLDMGGNHKYSLQLPAHQIITKIKDIIEKKYSEDHEGI